MEACGRAFPLRRGGAVQGVGDPVADARLAWALREQHPDLFLSARLRVALFRPLGAGQGRQVRLGRVYREGAIRAGPQSSCPPPPRCVGLAGRPRLFVDPFRVRAPSSGDGLRHDGAVCAPVVGGGLFRAGKLRCTWPRTFSSSRATRRDTRRPHRERHHRRAPHRTRGAARSRRNGRRHLPRQGDPGAARAPGRVRRHRARAGGVPPRRGPHPPRRLRDVPRRRAQARARDGDERERAGDARRGRRGHGRRGRGGRGGGRRRPGARRGGGRGQGARASPAAGAVGGLRRRRRGRCARAGGLGGARACARHSRGREHRRDGRGDRGRLGATRRPTCRRRGASRTRTASRPSRPSPSTTCSTTPTSPASPSAIPARPRRRPPRRGVDSRGDRGGDRGGVAAADGAGGGAAAVARRRRRRRRPRARAQRGGATGTAPPRGDHGRARGPQRRRAGPALQVDAHPRGRQGGPGDHRPDHQGAHRHQGRALLEPHLAARAATSCTCRRSITSASPSASARDKERARLREAIEQHEAADRAGSSSAPSPRGSRRSSSSRTSATSSASGARSRRSARARRRRRTCLQRARHRAQDGARSLHRRRRRDRHRRQARSTTGSAASSRCSCPSALKDVVYYNERRADLRRVRHRGRDRPRARRARCRSRAAATSSSTRPRRSPPSTSTPGGSSARARRTWRRRSSRRTSRPSQEIAYQLRFRNIGGLIILDLIDMEKRVEPREGAAGRSRSSSSKDKAKTTLNRISDLGLIEMTRKRTRESLGRLLHEPCFYCDGTGQLQSQGDDRLRDPPRDPPQAAGSAGLHGARQLPPRRGRPPDRQREGGRSQEAESRYMRRITRARAEGVPPRAVRPDREVACGGADERLGQARRTSASRSTRSSSRSTRSSRST